MMIRIEVTAEDIERGVLADCTECPVALAVERATGDQAHVYDGSVTLTSDCVYTSLPDDVNRRIRAYDAGESMVPFSFELPDLETWTVLPDDED